MCDVSSSLVSEVAILVQQQQQRPHYSWKAVITLEWLLFAFFSQVFILLIWLVPLPPPANFGMICRLKTYGLGWQEEANKQTNKQKWPKSIDGFFFHWNFGCLPQETWIQSPSSLCSRSSHTSDSKIGILEVTLPGAWPSRVRARTGQPSVSMLWLGKIASFLCYICLSVVACATVRADDIHP